MAHRITQPNDSVALILDGSLFDLLEQNLDLRLEIKIDGSKLSVVPLFDAAPARPSLLDIEALR